MLSRNYKKYTWVRNISSPDVILMYFVTKPTAKKLGHLAIFATTRQMKFVFFASGNLNKTTKQRSTLTDFFENFHATFQHAPKV